MTGMTTKIPVRLFEQTLAAFMPNQSSNACSLMMIGGWSHRRSEIMERYEPYQISSLIFQAIVILNRAAKVLLCYKT